MKIFKILSVILVLITCACRSSLAAEEKIREVYCTPPLFWGGEYPDYIIMIDKNLYEFEGIKAKLGRYTDSKGVKHEGYIEDAERDIGVNRCRLVTVENSTRENSTTPEEIKEYIKSNYSDSNIYGVVEKVFLIGNIPYARYEKYTDSIGSWYYHKFSSDLFYMDIDGVWKDRYTPETEKEIKIKVGNGIYDTHTGDKGAEVVVGRAYIKNGWSTATKPSTDYIKGYFDKISNYRRGAAGFKPREYSLAYRSYKLVQEWANWPEELAQADRGLTHYGFKRILIKDKKKDNAAAYQAELSAKPYEACSISAHGSKFYQQFYDPNGSAENRFKAGMLPKGTAGALFYTIASCNTADIKPGFCLALSYLYEAECSLSVIGASSAIYCPPYYLYYKYLGDPNYLSTGEAFLNFMQSKNYAYGTDDREEMMLFGDPILRLYRNELRTIEPAQVNPGSSVTLHGKFNEKGYSPKVYILDTDEKVFRLGRRWAFLIEYGKDASGEDYAVVKIPKDTLPGTYYVMVKTGEKYSCMKEITVTEKDN